MCSKSFVVLSLIIIFLSSCFFSLGVGASNLDKNTSEKDESENTNNNDSDNKIKSSNPKKNTEQNEQQKTQPAVEKQQQPRISLVQKQPSKLFNVYNKKRSNVSKKQIMIDPYHHHVGQALDLHLALSYYKSASASTNAGNNNAWDAFHGYFEQYHRNYQSNNNDNNYQLHHGYKRIARLCENLNYCSSSSSTSMSSQDSNDQIPKENNNKLNNERIDDDIDEQKDDVEDLPNANYCNIPATNPYALFSGAILQVQRFDPINESNNDKNWRNDEATKLLPSCQDETPSYQHFGSNNNHDEIPNNANNDNDDDDVNDQSTTFEAFFVELAYELIEPLYLQLGITPKHELDYAYKPVISPVIDGGSHDGTLSSREVEPIILPHEQDRSVVLPDESGPYFSWWRWWIPFANSWWWKPHGSTKSDYDMGQSAFAGGSHGEVWRGRRLCDITGTSTMNGQHDNSRSSDCNDQQSLILKRLRVEHGYRLLEAGLREVYFGNVLSSESTRNLFTSYVDHFYRELPRSPSPSSAAFSTTKEKELELWIVFKDAGPSLRSYLYSPISTDGFVLYQQSALWRKLRIHAFNESKSTQHTDQEHSPTIGKGILRTLLEQILTSAAHLHDQGIVHRDIKPSNVMCTSNIDLLQVNNKNLEELLQKPPTINCVLGDFSSAWNNFTNDNLYTNGPSPAEQTDEYAPPEAVLGPQWVPFYKHKPQSYDSWSIGVLALELLLGTPNVFSVDQRTTVVLTHKMERKGATADEIQRALYLAALSQFCIFVPSGDMAQRKSWPLQDLGLHNTAMVKESCTLHDFHRALRARDPLGIGFDSSTDMLLHLIWRLLEWDPMNRITARDALDHPYFRGQMYLKDNLTPGFHNALESQMLDPRMDFDLTDNVNEFKCPKCGRIFDNWQSCQTHATSRKHAKFCVYDRSSLPTCLNAHSMLPAHPMSGYCDIQGRRRVIEDFHSIHLHPSKQFYGLFDGHTGNLASKFVASKLYVELDNRLSNLNQVASQNMPHWKELIEDNVTQAFFDIHEQFLEAVSLVPKGSMDQSGTTATAIFVTDEAVVVASLGDSRAVLSSYTYSNNENTNNIAKDNNKISVNTISAIQLTKDHVASDPIEQEQVISRGGFISSSSGGKTARVNGTLAITRSIGDANLAPLLSRNPHVVSMTRLEIRNRCGVSDSSNNDATTLPCFVVLASDGLWDVISNQEAVDMVADVISNYNLLQGSNSMDDGGAFQEAAQVLTIEAYVRGSTDNIGVCVIGLT